MRSSDRIVWIGRLWVRRRERIGAGMGGLVGALGGAGERGRCGGGSIAMSRLRGLELDLLSIDVLLEEQSRHEVRGSRNLLRRSLEALTLPVFG